MSEPILHQLEMIESQIEEIAERKPASEMSQARQRKIIAGLQLIVTASKKAAGKSENLELVAAVVMLTDIVATIYSEMDIKQEPTRFERMQQASQMLNDQNQ